MTSERLLESKVARFSAGGSTRSRRAAPPQTRRNSDASGNSASGRRPGHSADRAARLRSSPAAPGAWTKKICFEPTISHPAERCPQSGLRTLERNLALLIPSPDPVAQSSGHVLREDASSTSHIYLVDRRRNLYTSCGSGFKKGFSSQNRPGFSRPGKVDRATGSGEHDAHWRRSTPAMASG